MSNVTNVVLTYQGQTYNYPSGPKLKDFFVFFRPDGRVVFHNGALGNLKSSTWEPAVNLTAYHVSLRDDNGNPVSGFIGDVAYNGEIDVPSHWWQAQWTYRKQVVAAVLSPAQIVAARLMFPYGHVNQMTEANRDPRMPYMLLGSSGITKYMPTTGERRDIGLETDPEAFYMEEGYAVDMLDWAHSAGSCPLHLVDESTGRPVDQIANPINMYDAAGYQAGHWVDKGPAIPATGTVYLADGVTLDKTAPGYNPGSSGYHNFGGGWTPQQAHFCEMSYLAHCVTLDLGFLEDLQHEANFVMMGDGKKNAAGIPLFSGEYRGIAWAIRTVAMAHTATRELEKRCLESGTPFPDYLLPSSYFKTLLDANLVEFMKTMNSTDPTVQCFRTILPMPRFGPWQHEYMMLALAYLVLSGHPEWEPLYRWCLGNVIARTNGNMTPPGGYPVGYGGAYYLNTVRGQGQGWDGNRGRKDPSVPASPSDPLTLPPSDWGKKYVSWAESFEDMQLHGGDPWEGSPSGITTAQYDKLLTDVYNSANGYRPYAGREYLQNTHSNLAAAAYLNLTGLSNVRGTYPELDACTANVERMLAGDRFNERAAIVADPSASPTQIPPPPVVTTPPVVTPPDTKPPTGVIMPTARSIKVGETVSLPITFTPDGADLSSLTIKAVPEGVVSVLLVKDANGKPVSITTKGLKSGLAKVIGDVNGETADGSPIVVEGECDVTVAAAVPLARTLTIG